jgi:beta-lactamase regulating signal transducer with metallopeptidase domain
MSSFDALIPILLRASLLVLISGLAMIAVLRRLRPNSARVHRLVWAGVLINGILLAPLTVDLPWLEPLAVGSGPDSTEPAGSLSGLPSVTGVESASFAEGSATAVASESPAIANAGAVSMSAAHNSHHWTASTILGFVWLSGAVLFVLAGAGSWFVLQRLLLNATTADSHYQEELNQLCLPQRHLRRAADETLPAVATVARRWTRLIHALASVATGKFSSAGRLSSRPGSAAERRNIPLLMHDALGPMLCLTPRGYRIVVPHDDWAELTHDERQAILRHELAHRDRHDVWKSLGMRLLALMHWFNPMGWWAARRFEEAAEWACDESLADVCPEQVPTFAAALLRLAERQQSTQRQHRSVGVSAAQGAPLATRLKRLLDENPRNREDSIMLRATILAVLGVALAAGLFRFQLVAREADDDDGPQSERSASLAAAREESDHGDDLQRWEGQARELAAQVRGEDERLISQFREALGTEPGIIVLRDRAGRMAAEARGDAQANLMSDFFAEHFDDVDGEYHLREDQSEYRDHVLRTSSGANADMEAMQNFFAEAAERLITESDDERLFQRFMTSEAAPVMVYIEHVQKRIRPTLESLLDATDGLFVQREDGRFGIHPARREQAEEGLQRAELIERGLKFVRSELNDWHSEIASPDDFHNTVIEAMRHPAFATWVVLQASEGQANRVEFNRRMEKFFQHLEEATEDTADGLVFRAEAQEEVGRAIHEFHQLVKAAETIEEPVSELAEQFADDDELNREWKRVLHMDVVKFRFAAAIGTAGLDAGEAVERLLSNVVQETDDGKLRLAGEEPEAIREFVNKGFRDFRTFRRHARIVDQYVSRIKDEELHAAFQTWGGRIVIRGEIERRLRTLSADGLSLWVDAHFEETTDGLLLKPESGEALTDFLADVDAVNRELANDDFQRSSDSDDDDRDE